MSPALDSRLIDLIETLLQSNLGWLASEVLDGVRAGHVEEEPLEALLAARAMVGREQQDNLSAQASEKPEADERPFSPGEQVSWAVGYISQRLGDTVAMMSKSLRAIEVLTDLETDDEAGRGRPSEPALVFTASEVRSEARAADLERAQNDVAELDYQLRVWAESVGVQGRLT